MARPPITWVTTDWHFGHRRMEEICGRPKDFELEIDRRHRAVIAAQDTVVNLGDVLMYSEHGWQVMIALFNNTHRSSVLVLGNHDKKTKTWYRGTLAFDVVCDGIIIDGCLLTHKPTPPPPGLLNIHGHWHNLGDRINESPGYDPARQFCVSLEHTGYKLLKLADIKRKMEAK